jgi:hypothetical protein
VDKAANLDYLREYNDALVSRSHAASASSTVQ